LKYLHFDKENLPSNNFLPPHKRLVIYFKYESYLHQTHMEQAIVGSTMLVCEHENASMWHISRYSIAIEGIYNINTYNIGIYNIVIL